MKKNRPTGAVLVCGAGIAGIQASLDLAESGFKVYLLEPSLAIGGKMAMLDKTFPTGDCAMCIISPKLVAIGRNKNIEILTLAEIESLRGEAGHFEAVVRQRPRYVDSSRCNACGDCSEACPVTLPSEFDRGLGGRKAIFRPYPQAIPNVFGIVKSEGRAPCKASCPAGVNVQGYVALIAKGKIKEAYDVIRERCPLPAVCGRICQHPCQTQCNRKDLGEPVSARDLKRFAADYVYAHREETQDVPPQPATPRKEKVAIIGGGPAGLTAAADLRTMGYSVAIFDAKPLLGGMLRYGIPRYRLPEGVLNHEIQYLLDMGIEAKTSTRLADPTKLLKARPGAGHGGSEQGEFDAVFVAVGAGISRKLNIPGEDAKEVWPGLQFLHEVNTGARPPIGPSVLVIGGGDVAMDAARCARRIPGVGSVQLACLERRDQMPAHSWEAAEALEEGIVFHTSLGPTKILTENGRVTGVAFRACTRVFDEAGRFSPQFDDSLACTLAADTVIVTIGQGVDAAALAPVATGPGGRIVADRETLATNVPGVFAGGDGVLGPASLVDAMAHGHRAAQAIHRHLREKTGGMDGWMNGRTTEQANRPLADSAIHPPIQSSILAPNPRPGARPEPRRPMPQAAVGERLADFREIDLGYSQEEAVAEALRCLSCGLCSECRLCEKACKPGAICHGMTETTRTLQVGAVLLTPGFDEFEAAARGEYGHGRYANVLSSVQFERLLSAAGPTEGVVKRLSDGKPVKRLAFIQCVGSRESARGRGYCSSTCCMSATKEAVVAMEHEAGLQAAIFCMDVRAFGKEFDRYVDRASDEYGVRYVRAIPSRVVEMPGTKNPRVRYLDEAGGNAELPISDCQLPISEEAGSGQRVSSSSQSTIGNRQSAMVEEEFDLVVLSVGMKPGASVERLAGRLGLDLNAFGFCQTDRLAPMATSRPGVFVAGTFQEPKDIPESVAQASGAASCAMELLARSRGTLVARREYPWERDVTDEEPRIGVFICHCGHNIASVVNVEAVAAAARKLPNVAHAEANLYTCSDTTQKKIKDLILEHRLNRLVVASCSPRTHEVLFQETLREAGLNPYLFAMANIRDQCSWVHRKDPVVATAKAIDLMRMAIGRARWLRALETGQLPITRAALVIGGGLAGLTAALSIADQGFEVHVVEKQPELGGNLRSLHTTLENPNVQGFLADLIRRVRANPQVKLYLNSQVVEVKGHVGHFVTQLKTPQGTSTVNHGVTIIATGAVERPTDEHRHGSDPRVITQRELEAKLASAAPWNPEPGTRNPETVVMLQCVGSRTAEHPYCSRVCCAEAVKNALALKAKLPNARIFVLAKDIRTYGFREIYFQKAREAGITFIRYPKDNEPRVENDAVNAECRMPNAESMPNAECPNGSSNASFVIRHSSLPPAVPRPASPGADLIVRVTDAGIGREVALRADLVVLSTGIAPAPDNPVISELLRTSLTADGFFLEAHPKLRPVDLATEGIFVCGLAHSPRFTDETIAQARAAAARAATVLSKPHLEIPGQVSRVDPLKCIACMTCVKVCPYGAPALNEETHKAEVQVAKCMGCGSCSAVCPAKAISLQHQEEQQLVAMLDELLVGQPAASQS